MVPSPTGATNTDGSPVLISQIDRYAYNSLGQVTRHQDPLGREERMIYAANGIDLLKTQQLIAKTASTNLDDWTWETTSQTTWDIVEPVKHLPLTKTDAAGQVTTYTYNSAGQIQTVTNARNEKTNYYYDPTGQLTGEPTLNQIGFLVQIDGPLSGNQDAITMTYDGPGRMTSRTDESGYTMTYAYDNLDRLLKTTYPDTTFEQKIYTILDPEWMRDRNGRWSRTIYDALRRPTKQYDPIGRMTENVWCACGSLENIIDPNGNATTFLYDLRGRQTMRIFPKATPTSTTQDMYQTEYDLIGRKAKFTDAKGQIMPYRYNLDNTLGSLLHESAAIATADTIYEYDPLYQRVKSVEDKLAGASVSKVSYTYHPVGQLGALQVNATTSTLPAETITHTYDVLGRKATCTVAGATETTTYDAGGRPDTITNPLGSFTYGYVAGSRRLDTVTRTGGLQTKYTYLPTTQDLRLESIETKRLSDSSRVSRYVYGYDAVGNILTWSQEQPTTASGPLATSLWTNKYTAADEVARSSIANPQASLASEYNYLYDKAGNRLSEQSGTTVKSWTNNAINQISSEQGGGSLRVSGQIGEPATVTINNQPVWLDPQNRFDTLLNSIVGTNTINLRAQDLAGNVTLKNWSVIVSSSPTKTSVYDKNGNLTSVTVSSDASQNRTYTWDARDRLLSVAVGVGTAGVKTYRFSYDALGRRVKITEENASGTVTTEKRYVWCGQQICVEKNAANGVTQRYYSQGFVDTVSNTNYYYTRDHLGSIREVLNAANILQTAFNYEAFGKQNRLFGSLNVDFGYTGHFTHAGSGLILTLYRVYDPTVGKWLSRDPIGEMGGINLYGYVLNKTFNSVDPLGLDIFDMLGIGAPIPDPAVHCFNAGWYQHCVNSCRLNKLLNYLHPFLAPSITMTAAMWSGHDFPWDPSVDWRDIAANAQGIFNSYTSNCITSCTQQFYAKRKRECCSNDPSKRKDGKPTIY